MKEKLFMKPYNRMLYAPGRKERRAQRGSIYSGARTDVRGVADSARNFVLAFFMAVNDDLHLQQYEKARQS